MADNIAVTAGTGTTIAADDVSGVLFQRVKVCYGVDGTGTDVNATTPMPVTLTNLEFAEDAAHTSGDKGVQALARFLSALTTSSNSAGTTGDYCTFNIDAAGRLYITQLPIATDGLTKFYAPSLTATGTTSVAAACSLRELTVSNGEASALAVIRVYDKATAATEADTPVLAISLAAGQAHTARWVNGLKMSNGISLRSSSLVNDATAASGNTANTVKATGVYV